MKFLLLAALLAASAAAIPTDNQQRAYKTAARFALRSAHADDLPYGDY